MISRAQQILIKRAQSEAGLPDPEYRQALRDISGLADCHSSTDSRLTDRHVDRLLGYFEAIYWRAVDAGQLRPSANPNKAVFRVRGYWARKNTSQETSRDRWAAASIQQQIDQAESELNGLGFGLTYLQGIQQRCRDAQGHLTQPSYLGALQRTLKAKRRRSENVPL